MSPTNLGGKCNGYARGIPNPCREGSTPSPPAKQSWIGILDVQGSSKPSQAGSIPASSTKHEIK